ncbi:uncharacterized protein BX664DRAFT_323475 [Halteromyces radiatus]|uniref:uncharacterized protein n=1 Tax=Halteromyces radiatus TaxID=101107 RepID=UPI00222104D2|nr:uncharacterized protein BX664DRAFT_323475 [Halteromyces radiatus]KAI8096254.1 hypothetical protein BX664DRAFT_323475 [Halteromyces radiatus]
MHTLPPPEGTEDYHRIPFQFTDKVSSRNVFIRLPDSFTPVERMVLQASGNLQRIISAYFNVPSHVEIIKNGAMPATTTTTTNSGDPIHQVYDRQTKIHFGDIMAYEADSIVIARDQKILELIEVHKYGLGQIFRYAQRTPDFKLLAVGRHGTKPGSSFWRDYSLRIPGLVDCFIRETFVQGLFHTMTDTQQEDGKGTIWFNQPLDTTI